MSGSLVAAVFAIGLSASVEAAPNLVANGELNFPLAAAPSHVSPSGDTAVFEFDDERSFGRAIVRGKGIAHELAASVRVGYASVTTANGRLYGLMVDTSDVSVNGSYDIALWFDLKGEIRPNRQYAYSVVSLPVAGNSGGPPALKLIAPAVWADGKLIGAEVELGAVDADAGSADSEHEQDTSPIQRGVVRMPQFKRITGGQFLICELPHSFKGQLFLERVSLREIDEGLLTGKKMRMPTPTRYVDIENPLERRIADTITNAKVSLRNVMSPDGNWGDVRTSALVLDVLGEMGEDLDEKEMRTAVRWLEDQEPTTVPEVAARLSFFARFGGVEHRQVLAKDVLWLENAQYDDGGWATVSHEESEDRRVRTDNVNTLEACLALRDASYAGVPTSSKMWRSAVRYWMEAQARDGGFRRVLPEYGGLGEATTIGMTATGLVGMYVTLDMAFSAGGSRCDQYLANRAQLDGIATARDWLDNYYGEYYRTLSSLSDSGANDPLNALTTAVSMINLIESAGVTRFNDKDVFTTEARTLLAMSDEGTGLFLGPLAEAGVVLRTLLHGGAPTAVQRIIVGGDEEHEAACDAYHIVRYMRGQRTERLNWRAATIDEPIERLVTVPILYVNVVGTPDWTDEQWRKIRDYCFGGGAVFFNVGEEQRDAVGAIETGLRIAFPEYELKPLAADDPILKARHEIESIKGMRVIGNGLKNFVFLAPEDWSCPLNLYDTDDRAEVFQFADNLLSYTLDDETPPTSFTRSTWEPGAVESMEIAAAELEIGADRPAYPDRLRTLDRSMRAGYRLGIRQIKPSASEKATFLWVACAGDKPMSDSQKADIMRRLREGTYLFAEVLSGDPNRAESFRSQLLAMDDGIRIRKMLLNHPLMTGFIPETQGFDVRRVELRKSLRDEYAKLPRADMHIIELDGQEVGAFSTYDVSAGLGYMYYPGCRGIMPKYCRQLATNVILHALDRETKPK